ncbi:UNVERIFIED_CONTAM: hypothetical protein NCL1_18836 [Trichonephila clavipes]
MYIWDLSKHSSSPKSSREIGERVREKEGPCPHGVLTHNWGGTEPNHTVTCLVLKARAPFKWHEFHAPVSETLYQVALVTTETDNTMSSPESLSSVNLDSSVMDTESHRFLVQETSSLAQDKRVLFCHLLRGSHVCRGVQVVLHKDLNCEDAFAPHKRIFFSLMLLSGLQKVETQEFFSFRPNER